MKINIPAICLLSVLQPLAAVAAKPLDDCLPANTTAIVSIANYSEIERQCQSGPLGNLVNNKQIRDVLKPCTDAIQGLMEEHKDDEFISWTDVKTHLSGQIVIGLDLTKILDELKATGDTTDAIPSIILLADVKDGDGLIALFRTSLKEMVKIDSANGREADTEAFMGADIHHFIVHDALAEKTAIAAADAANAAPADAGATPAAKPVDPKTFDRDFFYGNLGDTFFASLDIDSVRSAIEAIKGNEKGTLAENGLSASLRAQTDKLDAFIYINAKPLEDLVEAGIRSEVKSDPNAQNPDPSKPSADAIINALGMSSFKSLLAGVKFEADNVHMNTVITVDSSYGIGRLARAYVDTYAMPDFVPDATTRAINSAGFNLSTFVNEIKHIAFTAYPPASFVYQAKIAQVKQQTSVDLDKDLLGNFGDGLVSFTIDNPDSTKTGLDATLQIFALKINDPTAFERSLSTVLAMTPIGPTVVQHDLMGSHIISIPLPGNNGKSLSITTKDGWVLICTDEAALQSVLSTDPAKKSFWQSTRYTTLGEGKLAPDGIGMSYCDFDLAVRQMLYVVAQVYNTTNSGIKNGQGAPIDTSLIQNVKDLPYTFCGKAYKTADGISSESYLIKK
jgi:hypothetical protein